MKKQIVKVKRKIAPMKKKPNLKIQAIQWLNHAQFHGANRLADSESSWFWIPSMVLLAIFASVLVYLTVIRYHTHPTYMQHTERGYAVLPFPAVLICPGINFRTFKKHEFLSSIKYPQGMNRSYVWKILPQLAAFFSPDVFFRVIDILKLEDLLNYNNIDVETAGRQLTETCEEILIRCQWRKKNINCSELFRLELTRDGFCCVFNGRSLRREIQEQVHIRKYSPLKFVSSFGYTNGLMVAINQTQKPLDIDLNYKWVALQEGQNFIDPTINGTPLNPGVEQWVAYYVKSSHITDAARGLGAVLRRCSLTDEELEYFPYYRKKYCVLECEILETIRRCHCIRMGHPKPKGIPYCTARRLHCAMHTSVEAVKCGCLPTCDVDETVVRSTHFPLLPNDATIDKFYKDLNYEKVTVLRTFVQKRIRKSNQRSSYYTYLDLFSQLGGMFNLFFGCSILTILGLVQLAWQFLVTLCVRLFEKLIKIRENILMKYKKKN